MGLVVVESRFDLCPVERRILRKQVVDGRSRFGSRSEGVDADPRAVDPGLAVEDIGRLQDLDAGAHTSL